MSDQFEKDDDARVWAPLKPGETRILVLQPGEPGDKLCADLRRVPIESEKRPSLSGAADKIVFEALSYTWGEPIFTSSIQCNGVEVGITKNLFDALQVLRRQHERRRLWVDALCIHQADDLEKAMQIPRLRDIYGHATRVIAWLGPAADHTEPAMARLKWFAGKLKAMGEAQHEGPLRDDDLLQATTLTANEGLGLYDLARRSWVYRIWVVQEVSAAKSITVLCGPHQIRWTTFILLYRLLTHMERFVNALAWPPMEESSSLQVLLKTDPEVAKRVIVAADALKFLYRMSRADRLRQSSNPALQLYRVLYETRHHQASDDRDRVFAVLGLTDVPLNQGDAHDDGANGIRIDYTRSMAEVYSEVTYYILSNIKVGTLSQLKRPLGSLMIPTLSLLNYFSRPDDVPSWCIDFRRNRIPELDPSCWKFRPPTYTPTTVALARSKEAPDCLVMRGRRLGVVRETERAEREIPRGHHFGAGFVVSETDGEIRPSRSQDQSKFYTKVPKGWRDALLSQVILRSEMPFHKCRLQNLLNSSDSEESNTTFDKKAAAIDLLISDLETNWRWHAHGAIEIGDIVADSSELTDPIILRPRADGRYTLVGTVQNFAYRGRWLETVREAKERRKEIAKHLASSYPENFIDLATWRVDEWGTGAEDWIKEEDFAIN